jgi:hypothetical protein
MNIELLKTIIANFTTGLITPWRQGKQSARVEKIKAELQIDLEKVKADFQGKLEKIKMDLDLEKEKHLQLVKWLITYETNIMDQVHVNLKEYFKTTQHIKDQLREFVRFNEREVAEERNKSLLKLRDEIICKYSEARFYFEDTALNRSAHTIKGSFLVIIHMLLSDEPHETTHMTELIDLITIHQQELHKGMTTEINRLYQSLQTSVSKN